MLDPPGQSLTYFGVLASLFLPFRGFLVGRGSGSTVAAMRFLDLDLVVIASDTLSLSRRSNGKGASSLCKNPVSFWYVEAQTNVLTRGESAGLRGNPSVVRYPVSAKGDWGTGCRCCERGMVVGAHKHVGRPYKYASFGLL